MTRKEKEADKLNKKTSLGKCFKDGGGGYRPPLVILVIIVIKW